MRAAVIAVGTELLLGDVVNTNAAWLGRKLRDAGIEVIASVAVPDERDRIVAELHRCRADADLVVLCGGLGPTHDDVTREALAAALAAPLVRDARLVAHLERVLSPYLPVIPQEVYRQADVPTGAEVLDNPAGTAPGLWLEWGGNLVIALPGPPNELRAASASIWSRLAARSGRSLTTRQVLVAGVGESTVADRLKDLVVSPQVTLSYLASGVVRVRFTSTEAQLLEPLVAATDEILGTDVFGHDEQTLDGVVHDLLLAGRQTVAVAESLTGGLLAAALSARAGASATFRGGVVVYATDLKEHLAGVPGPLLDAEGAVSPQTAAALAAGARDRLSADWGLAVTGVAGPTEQEGQPVGTVYVAVAGPDVAQVRQLNVPGDRARVRAAAVTGALDLLRRALVGGAR